MTKVVTIVGARPQFVKASVVSRALKSEGVNEVMIHTGQHFDANMSKIFFEEMEIPRPNYELGIHSLTHGAMTGRMMIEIERILLEEKPDQVMVYGDTNSTLAGALSAKKLNISLSHVEAGLRSFNIRMPEEINRIATDHISDILFCPTETAVKNSRAEGLGNRAEILLTGDVMYDALLQYKPRAKHPSGVMDSGYILCTLHRQENTDDLSRFHKLVNTLNEIATEYPVVIPVHPRIKASLNKLNIHNNIQLTDPVGYLEMISLITGSSLVITDSGGLQKEAFFCRKYCLTLREETEWVELVEHGYNHVVSDNRVVTIDLVHEFFGKKIQAPKPLYGLGNAASIIARYLSGSESSLEDSGKTGLPDRDLRRNLGCG